MVDVWQAVSQEPSKPGLLKADRLKAGGLKPGTWALNTITVEARYTAAAVRVLD
jgi:hypothetical protein